MSNDVDPMLPISDRTRTLLARLLVYAGHVDGPTPLQAAHAVIEERGKTAGAEHVTELWGRQAVKAMCQQVVDRG